MPRYQLMHLDDIVADVTIDDFNGALVSVEKIINPEIVPYRAARSTNDFRQWWADRAIPETRTELRDFLESRNIKSTGLYLLDNLGLSLTDCYWIKPYDSSIHWHDVNLYDNPFQASLTVRKSSSRFRQETTAYTNTYSPDASTGGNLPKWWIIGKGVRYLVKGNDGQTSQQSLNEILATKIHEAQGYSNYVPYSLVKLPNSRLGCRCAAFTSENEEFISAWELIGRCDYSKDESFRQNFIEACCSGGLDKSYVIKELDYMALTDFIICNTDRHLNNFGVLRDSRTLRFTKLAPIFDSGNSMMYKTPDQAAISLSLHEKTNGFYRSYKNSIEHVIDPSIVDISKLPSMEDIEKLYSRDAMLVSFSTRLTYLVHQRASIISDIQNGHSYYEAVKKYTPSRGRHR